MDIVFLLSISKIIAAMLFFFLAIVLLVLASRSSTILKALEIMDAGIHTSSAAIVSQGSVILTIILPILFRSQAKSNIWLQIFNMSPFSRNKRVNKLLHAITNLTESVLSLYKTLR